MDAELMRKINDRTHRVEWAANAAERMTVEQMLGYVYSPNSSFLEVAIRDRLRSILEAAGVPIR